MSQVQVFGTSNGNTKYNLIGGVFNRNVLLKQPVVKILFSCLDIILSQLFSIENFFCDELPAYLDTVLFVLFLFLEHFSASEIMFR